MVIDIITVVNGLLWVLVSECFAIDSECNESQLYFKWVVESGEMDNSSGECI